MFGLIFSQIYTYKYPMQGLVKSQCNWIFFANACWTFAASIYIYKRELEDCEVNTVCYLFKMRLLLICCIEKTTVEFYNAYFVINY